MNSRLPTRSRLALSGLIVVTTLLANSTASSDENQVVANTESAASAHLAELPSFRIERETRSALLEGVAITFHQAVDGKEHTDKRLSRLAAVHVAAGSPPTPFLAPGLFRATIEGFIKLKLKTKCSFRLAGAGRCQILLNDTALLTAEGADLSQAPQVSAELGKYTKLRIVYQSPDSGPATIRVYWRSDEFPWEQLPPTSLFCDGRDEELQQSLLARKGRALFANHGCHKCHGGVDLVTHKEVMPELKKDAPSLAGAGLRFQANWLTRWILSPQALRNHTTMPSLFPDAEDGGAQEEAADIAAFLESLKSPDPESGKLPTDTQEDGAVLFESLGCIACHSLQGDTEEDVDSFDPVSLSFVGAKYKPEGLARYLKDPRRHYSWSRMPDFRLSDGEAVALARYIRAQTNGELEKLKTESTPDAQRGQVAFTTRGCSNCHATGNEASNEPLRIAPLTKDMEAVGCLGTEPIARGEAPSFGFAVEDAAGLVAFLKTGTESLYRSVPEEAARRQIKRLNCTACHRLDANDGDLGFAIEEYGSGKPMDDLMPILTFAGERIHSAWIEKAMTGKTASRSRPWLKTRMPSFPVRATVLAHGLAAQHGFAPSARQPFEVDPGKAEVGLRLTQKEGGFDCLQCHGVGSRQPTAAFEARGINFEITAQRIRPEYYTRWMLFPQRFDPATKMPRFSSDGQKTSLDTPYGGDAHQQFESLWHYIQSLPKTESAAR